MMTTKHETLRTPTYQPSWQYSDNSQVRPKKVTQEEVKAINDFVKDNIHKDFRDPRQRAPKQLTLEEKIKQDFKLYDEEVEDLTNQYNESTEDAKKRWDKKEIEKINTIDNIQDLSEEDIFTILYGTISPVAQEYVRTMFVEKIMNALANSPETQERLSGGRRRRNKKRSIIRKKKRGKKTRKYRNIY